MAKAPARKLKVFQAQMGFYDTVVAASSQAAALRAWGVRQNLFADGSAKITQDAQAVEAALAHPDTPLKRAVGSTDPFGLDAALPKVPDVLKASKSAESATRRAAKSKPTRPPADRAPLDAAEAALGELDGGRKAEEAVLQHEQDDLERRRDAAQVAYVEARKAATAAVVAARAVYRKAGGEA